MKITVIGGSKGTGAQVAALAKAKGNEVTVLSRSGNAPAGTHSVTGDATDPAAAAEAVAGADAVIITVGGAKGTPNQREKVTKNVISAMKNEGVKRLIVQSSVGAGDSMSQLPPLMRPIVKVMLSKALADHNEQEAAVKKSGLDWTILRPTSLTDKEPTGSWTTLEVGQEGKVEGSLARQDLAALMLECIDDDSTIGKALGVS